MLLLAGTAYKLLRYRSWNRYYYAAGACAPANFPVYARELYFITGNGEMVHADTEAVNYFKTGWDFGYFFPETTAPELVPEKLVIKYASFREGSFYSDTIALPREKIAAIFVETLKSNTGEEIYYRGAYKAGLGFMIGIANGGNIIIWARDKNKLTEITRVKISPVVPGENDTYYGGAMTKEAYLEDRFRLLGDSIQALIRSGFDADANYADSSIVH